MSVFVCDMENSFIGSKTTRMLIELYTMEHYKSVQHYNLFHIDILKDYKFTNNLDISK